MPQSVPALIQPSLLIWARESAGFFRLEDVASKAEVEVEMLRQWEHGENYPSIAQLRKLGEIYKRPLAIFFLPKPPNDFDPQREFRRLPALMPAKESPELRFALRTALFRREAAMDLHERLGEPLADLKEKAHPHEEIEIVGQRMRDILGIEWETQVKWSSAYVALNAWREAVERLGILVFQTGGIELNEMRGTSIPHGPLPVILLNNADAPHGRIFTLLHEFAHILLTKGGHHTSPMEGQRLPEDQRLEKISNRFAAAALMPRSEFLAEAARQPAVLQGDEEALRRFAGHIKVSPEAILRRLVSLHKVSVGLYRGKRRGWQQQPWFVPPAGAGGPPIEVKIISSAGRSFVSLVLEGYQRHAVSSADVSDYLGVQLKHLDKIAGQLLPKPGATALA